MGKVFENDKDNVNATLMYQKGVELNKLSGEAHFRLGWMYVRNGDKKKGLEHLKKALTFIPDNSELLTKLGEVLLKDQNTFNEAETYIKKALLLDNNIPDALVSMGRILDKQGNIDEAITCYEKAVRLPNTNVNAFYHLGVLLEKRKDYKKSIQLFK